MNKIHFTLCFLIGIFSSLSLAAQAPQNGDTFIAGPYEYYITSIAAGNRTVSLKNVITVSKNMTVPNEVTHPKDNNVYKVTAIKGAGGSGAFINRDVLETMVLGDNVKTIEPEGFFGCYNLRSIDLKNVTTIDKMAFRGCTSLKTIQSEAVTEVGFQSFEGCTALTTINFPNIQKIGQEGFLNCTLLSTITISEAPQINNKAFENTAWLNSQPNGVVYLNKVLYTYKGTMPANTHIDVREDTERIAGWALALQDGLQSINMKNVKHLDSEPFSSCANLKSVTTWCPIPPTLTDNFALGRNLNLDNLKIYVPKGYEKTYKETQYWEKYKNNIVGGDAPIQTVCNLTDGEDYTNTKTIFYNQINYTRNFKHNKWQPLYIPYSMKYEDWADKFEVARLNNVHQYDKDGDSKVDLTNIEIIRVKKGQTLPNMPYVIRARQTGVHTLTTANTELLPAQQTQVSCASFTSTFYFNGTYTRYRGTGHFVMDGGSLRPAADENTGPGAYRWYLNIDSRDSEIDYSNKKIYLVEEGEDITGLEEIETTETSFDIYNINGQLIKKNAKDMKGLPRGIYIVNGQKIIL